MEDSVVNVEIVRMFGISLCHNPLEALIKYKADYNEWVEIQAAVKRIKHSKKKKKGKKK